MQLDINLADLLSDGQKQAIGDLYYTKVIQAVDDMDIGDSVKTIVDDFLTNEYIDDYIDASEIGELVTKKILAALK